jgi:hypothetical protein
MGLKSHFHDVRDQIREVGGDQLRAHQPMLTALAGLLASIKRSESVFTRPGVKPAFTSDMQHVCTCG